MADVLDHLRSYAIPAAYAVLPPAMHSPEATAMLLAIALQESKCAARRQLRGPARGFWQFETGGVAGVRRHPMSREPLTAALTALCYPSDLPAKDALLAIEDNDVLAAVYARLLLWTLPDRLPARAEPDEGWRQYLSAWRPGKPRPATWASNYALAWNGGEDT